MHRVHLCREFTLQRFDARPLGQERDFFRPTASCLRPPRQTCRTHLRGHENILKRLLIHVGAFNLSLIFRNLLGSGRRESREIASHRPFLRSFSCSATLQCLWVVQLCFFIGKTQLVSEAALSTIQTPARKKTRFRHGLLGMPISISLDPAKLLFRMPTLNEPERFTPLVLIGTENAGRLDKACPDVLSPGDA
jgi:hypothetical protein